MAPVSWVTAENNLPLLQGIEREVRCVSWENRKLVADTTYDLVINLEDDRETSSFLKKLKFKQLFGAYLNGDDTAGLYFRFTRLVRLKFD